LAQEVRNRIGRGAKELAESREGEEERERKRVDAEQVGRSMHERNSVRLGRGDETKEGE
jgi:hypothetical protein